jgi:hypothetical protein
LALSGKAWPFSDVVIPVAANLEPTVAEGTPK